MSERLRDGRGIPRWASARRLHLNAIGGIGAVLLVLASPVSGSVISPPYWGDPTSTLLQTHQTDCGVTKTFKSPTFGKRLGLFKAAGEARSPYCPSSSGHNEASWDARLGFVRNLTFSGPAPHYLNISWKLRYSVDWNLTPFRTCALNFSSKQSTCFVESVAWIVAVPYLFDLNNTAWNGGGFVTGSWLDIPYVSYVYNESDRSCRAGTCWLSSTNLTQGNLTGNVSSAQTVNESMYLYASASINTNDSFQLQIVLDLELETLEYSANAVASGHAHVWASANAATKGRAIRLSSVSFA